MLVFVVVWGELGEAARGVQGREGLWGGSEGCTRARKHLSV
jgi:hypothetical protein